MTGTTKSIIRAFLNIVAVGTLMSSFGCATGGGLPTADTNGDGVVDDSEWTQYQRNAAVTRDRLDKSQQEQAIGLQYFNAQQNMLNSFKK